MELYEGLCAGHFIGGRIHLRRRRFYKSGSMVIVACSDGIRPVIFKVERTDMPSDTFNEDLEICRAKSTKGGFLCLFSFKKHPCIQGRSKLMCPNLQQNPCLLFQIRVCHNGPVIWKFCFQPRFPSGYPLCHCQNIFISFVCL